MLCAVFYLFEKSLKLLIRLRKTCIHGTESGLCGLHVIYASLSLFLLSGQYEPRGPGRPLYQRRISSSYPDEASPANTHNALSQQPQPCTSEPQDHPHPHIQHHQQPHGPYNYPSHDLWPSNGGGPGPFQNIPCNGAGALAQHRDLLGGYCQTCF